MAVIVPSEMGLFVVECAYLPSDWIDFNLVVICYLPNADYWVYNTDDAKKQNYL